MMRRTDAGVEAEAWVLTTEPGRALLAAVATVSVPGPADQARWRKVLEPRGWVPEFRDWMNLPDASMNMTGHEIRVVDDLQEINEPLRGVGVKSTTA